MLKGYEIRGKYRMEWRVKRIKIPKMKIVRPHVHPWSTWLDSLPSLEGLNRRDVRIIASKARGKFPLALQHTSYVSTVEVFCLRKALRHYASLKRELLMLRRELIEKTQGKLLDNAGCIYARYEPQPDLQLDVINIKATLRIFDALAADIR